MNIILWIVLGSVTGWLVSLVLRTNKSKEGFLDVLIGVVGAVMGGWFMEFFSGPTASGFTIFSLLISIVAAVVLVGSIRIFQEPHKINE